MSKPYTLVGYHPEYIEAVQAEALKRLDYYLAKGKLIQGPNGPEPNPNWPKNPVNIYARTQTVYTTVMAGGRFCPPNARPEQIQ